VAAALTIGEFSVMSQLSKKALRHYHDLGLLEPAHVDPLTGYRRYNTDQLQIARIIRRFRGLGMSVPDIKGVLATDDVDRRNEIIAAHLRDMESKLQETQQAVGALRELLQPASRPLDVELRSVPAFSAWAVSATVTLSEFGHWYADAMREIRTAMAGTGGAAAGPPGGIYARDLFSDEVGEATVFIPTREEAGQVGRAAVVRIPAVELAVAIHLGGHEDVDRSYGALGTYVTERLLSIDGPVRENYLDADEATGLARTEICWPVFSTAAR
jgi:DNA-binding transcriptional MerR regulator